MDAKKKLKVGLDSLKKARLYTKDLNYGRAFAHYLVFLELVEQRRNKYEKQFTEVISAWGKLLEERKETEDLCKCYLQALNYFPLNIEILTNFGAHLIRIDEFEEAKQYLQSAHNLCNDFLPAEKNLMTVKGELVERWHFPMLNDYERNMAYYKAILAYSNKMNFKVVDIGTGCGLLSLFASNNENVASIYAIEDSKTLSTIANDVFQANNMTKVTLFNKHSTELSCEDLSGGADLIVTEIFDNGLFGENVLEILIHAWENLSDGNCEVIPHAASLYVTGIECFDLLRTHKLLNYCDDLNLFDVCVVANTDEPYDSTNLKLCSYKAVTTTEKVLTINFQDIDELKQLQASDHYSLWHKLKVICAGRLDAFAIWFDLHLDKNTTITTDPTKENVTCWEQAIVYVNHPPSYNVDADVEIRFNCPNGRLQVCLVDEPRPCTRCFKASTEVLTFLNDTGLVATLEKLYDSTVCDKVILDAFPFPILGMKYAKNSTNRIYCIAETKEDKAFIEQVCSMNNINKENVVIMELALYRYLIANDAIKFDIIYVNPVHQNGTVDENYLLNFKNHRTKLKRCLKPGGVIYPRTLNLVCQVIESDFLCNFNVVNDENSFGFRIASHLNQYSVNEHYELDKKFKHKKLSTPLCVGDLLTGDENISIIKHKVSILQSSKVDGILYWFEFTFNDDVKVDTSLCPYYKYASFIVDRREIQQEWTELVVCVKQHGGLFKIYYEV